MEATKPTQTRKRAVMALGYILDMDDIYELCSATNRVVPPDNADSFFMGPDLVDLRPSTYYHYLMGLLKTCGLQWETTILSVYDPHLRCRAPCFVLATDETKAHKKFDREVLNKAKEYLGREEDPVWYTRLRE